MEGGSEGMERGSEGMEGGSEGMERGSEGMEGGSEGGRVEGEKICHELWFTGKLLHSFMVLSGGDEGAVECRSPPW